MIVVISPPCGESPLSGEVCLGDVACYPWASLPSPFPLGDGLGIAPYNKGCQLSGCHAYFLMLDI